jgi:heptosyltransferase-2
MGDRPQNIVILGPTWVGDIVMATAAFADIRRAFPAARITLLLRPGREGIVAGADYFDEVIPDRSARSLRNLAATARELRRRRFDLAILFPDSFRAGLLARLAGIPRRAGFRRNLRGPLLTDPVEHRYENGRFVPEPMPARFGKILAALGIPSSGGRPQLAVTAEEEERARVRRARLGIAEGEPLVGLNPGASFGASKLWPPRRFARLGDLIAERWGARSVILAGPGEEALAREIEASMRSRPISTAADPIPLGELKPFIRGLRLLVTTDAGPRHYAVAFRVPAVVVMGPTDPRHTAIHLEETEVIRLDLPCSPCHLKNCPIDHRCMTGIPPEAVLERIESLDRRLRIFAPATA